jgi:O-antigen ligase
VNILDLLLIVLAIYVPNQLHFPSNLGLKGMNILNLLLILTILAMVATGARARTAAPLGLRLGLFASLLVAAFVVAQLRAPADILEDLTVLKSAVTYILLYFIFYHSARDARRSRRLVATILVVAFVAAVEAIREGFSYGLGSYTMTHRAAGPFGQTYENANRAGVFYAMFLPLFLSMMLFSRSKKAMALLGMAGTGAALFAVFVTYSRQSYVIAATAIFVMGIKRNILIGALLGALMAGWTVWAPQAAIERLEMTYVEGDSGEESLEVSAESRLLIWRQALRMVREHPFGVGLNRFRSEIGGYGDLSGKDAHNGFVLVAAEAGLQGLFALMLVMGGLLRNGWRLIRAGGDEGTRVLGYGYTGAVVCMILGNLYGSPIFFGEVMGNFWALSGLVARQTEFISGVHQARPGPARRP